jgi:hypothetical protein
MSKVTVVGAGNVGATCANVLAFNEVADEVVMLDVKEGVSEGKAMDMMQTAQLLGFDGVSFYAFHQAKENKEMSELFAVEKLEMENEYTTFATQYDELQIQINNDSLREKLESEKLKTQRLLEELRQVKTSNAAEIMRLKKELKTVRAVLRTYVIQIDSLNKLNQALAEENQEVKQKYTQATRQINNLSQEKKNLNEKVTLAAQLDATGISVEPRNKRGKTAKKVKDVKKIAISFTIVKNITAKTGERTLYIRIAKPDNDILTKNASNTFPYENRNLVYSIKKYIEYTGEEQNVTVYWDVEEYLPAGTYHVYIFADGTMIGQQAFSMK